MKLNPQKCVFGVIKGKLLGYVVSQKGIEADPAKISAIQDMPVPRTKKEIRGFLGNLQYISRFISQLTQTGEPIFKLLQKNSDGQWNEQCQAAFDKIREYLSKPPVLTPPQPGSHYCYTLPSTKLRLKPCSLNICRKVERNRPFTISIKSYRHANITTPR